MRSVRAPRVIFLIGNNCQPGCLSAPGLFAARCNHLAFSWVWFCDIPRLCGQWIIIHEDVASYADSCLRRSARCGRARRLCPEAEAMQDPAVVSISRTEVVWWRYA